MIDKSEILIKYAAGTKTMFQVMDENGVIVNPDFHPGISDEELLKVWKFMLFVRTADLRSVSYQRQGRMYTYPPNLGQEAVSVGSGWAMQDEDWLVPAFREMGAWLLKGATLKELFLYWSGHEDGMKLLNAPRMLPVSVPISSQIPHATGIAFSLKYKNEKGVVFVYFGDGGTSQGDFHEGINFAAVWRVPVVFINNNNQYAISVSRQNQTASESIAIKSKAYGIPGIQVDGNDFLGVYAATRAARQSAEKGVPVLIEAVTYRQGAHTTSDDPGRYRTKKEEQEWQAKDPILRLKKYLLNKNLISDEDENLLIGQYGKEIDAQFSEAENYPAYKLSDIFQYQYSEMPDFLQQQMQDHEKYMKTEAI